jgi:hypothetical protein
MNNVLGDVPKMIANGKKVLPDGIRSEVTPALSKAGEYSMGMHVILYSKESYVTEKEKVKVKEEKP